MTTGYVLLGIAVGIGALDWHAVKRRDREREYLLKPLTMVVLVIAAVALCDGDRAYVCGFTVAALVLSLAGDVFLMLPGDLFVPGLASFLPAHAAYIVAFNPTAPPAGLAIGGAVVVAVAAVPMYATLLAGMRRQGSIRLAGPVAVYTGAISAMVVSAASTLGRPEWAGGESALAIAGALLFYASDGMIGWSRFVGDFPGSRVAIIVTYHLAQAALVMALLG